MNLRQRRGVLLLILALFLGGAAYLAASGYIADVESRVGPEGPTLVLNEPVSAFSSIPESAVEVVDIPERWIPSTAVRSREDLEGVVAAAQLPSGTVLQTAMLVPEPAIEPGEREMTIMVDRQQGRTDRLQPGTLVDLVATFDPDGEDSRPLARIALDAIEVLAVGEPATADTGDVSGTGGVELGRGVPVTFVLSVPETMRMAYIQSFAREVRVSLRHPTDEEPIPDPQRGYAPIRSELQGGGQ